jgi:hypothetical protein
MAEIVDPLLVAWQFDEPMPPDRVERALRRVARHYQALAHEPLEQDGWIGERRGMASFTDPGLHRVWPACVHAGEIRMASAYVPVGWERIFQGVGAEEAPTALAEAVWRRPEAVSEALNTPAVVMAADVASGTVRVMNDLLGAGHLYECRFDGGSAWSSRAGALPLFGEFAPSASERGWRLFAANGWFMRDTTPIEGVTKVAPSSVIELSDAGVERRSTNVLAGLLAPGQDYDAAVEEFVAQAQDTVRAAAAAYPKRAHIDLSGGRDSRVSAAAALAAGVDAGYRTSDVAPGEADVARELVAAAPSPMRHRVKYGGQRKRQRPTPLSERARAMFLLHDGMRSAAKVRGRLQLPPTAQDRATISGHGGELGHGFYVNSPRLLRRLDGADHERLVKRLVKSTSRAHDAPTKEVYAAAQAEFEAAIGEGAAIGIEGPTLLDFYYLIDRFAHRSGLASTTHRATVFATPAFLRAAFALTPEERLEAKLHQEAIAKLVPEWSDIPFYAGGSGRLPKLKRERIWEGQDGEELGRMLKDGRDLWSDLFRPRRVRKMWREARRGKGHRHYEGVFERIACRVAFEDYRRLLTDRLSS